MKPTPHLPVQYEALLKKMVEGNLTEADHEELATILAEAPELRADFIAYCQTDALLQEHHEAFTTKRQANRRSHNPAAQNTAPTPKNLAPGLWLAIAAAAAIIVVSLIANQNTIGKSGSSTIVAIPPPVEPLASYSGAVGAVLTDTETSAPMSIGTKLGNRPYHLSEGHLELSFDTGAKVIIEAPAQFHPTSQNAMHLIRGRASATVPPSATGFTITSKGLEVIDIGTEFAMDVPDDAYAEVHVFKGEVVIKAEDDDGYGRDATHLSAGTALRIYRGSGQPTGIDLAKDRFVRKLDDPNTPYIDRVRALEPTLYYPMEPSDNPALLRDFSGNGLHAHITGIDSKGARWTKGLTGNALQLAGPRQAGFAVIEDYPKAQANTITCMAWIYAESRPQWGSVMKNWTGHKPGQFHFGLYDWTGDLEVHVNSADDREIFAREHVPLPLKQWHHVAFVADGKQLRLFRNGEQVAATRYNGLHFDPDVSALAIGTKLWRSKSDPNPGHDFSTWHGKIDEVAIFNHALTDEQIQHLYQYGKK